MTREAGGCRARRDGTALPAPLASRAALRQNGPMKLSWNEIRARAAADAARIVIAVANGIAYPVTSSCRRSEYEPPVICTPNELLGTDDADDAD